MKIIRLTNEDGTSIDDTPKNPLLEKWYKEFPMKESCKLIEENNIVNYSCLDCGHCPNGDLFEIPKEDLKEYNKFLKKYKKYLKKHNPSMKKILKNEKL